MQRTTTETANTRGRPHALRAGRAHNGKVPGQMVVKLLLVFIENAWRKKTNRALFFTLMILAD
jgi:hypothetical protein